MQDLAEVVKNSTSKKDVLTKMGMAVSGSSYNILRRKLKKLNIDTSHFNQYLGTVKEKTDWVKFETYLVKDSKCSGTHWLKLNLVKKGHLKYECTVCKNNGQWQGKKISLHLDHINGIRNDNRIENLRILCPNCHSQTETYAGKKLKRNNKKWKQKSNKCKKCNVIISDVSKCCLKCSRQISETKPPKERLEELVQTLPMVKIGLMYRVTDNTVRKWCKGYGINYRIYPKGHWQKIYTEKFGTNGCCKK